jgi:hypothetical protein
MNVHADKKETILLRKKNKETNYIKEKAVATFGLMHKSMLLNFLFVNPSSTNIPA